MLNRLTKSAETQARLDEEYFKINMEGQQMRLRLENTLKNCHQVGKEALPRLTATHRRRFVLFFSRKVLYLRNEPSDKAVTVNYTSVLPHMFSVAGITLKN